MKVGLFSIICFSLLACTFSLANAMPLSFSFSAEVYEVGGQTFGLEINVGDSIKGTAVYFTGMNNEGSSPEIGVYNQPNGSLFLCTERNDILSVVPSRSSFIQVLNNTSIGGLTDHSDKFQFTQEGDVILVNAVSRSVNFGELTICFGDAEGSVFPEVSIPTITSLDDFELTDGILWGGSDLIRFGNFQIASSCYPCTPVPEPSTLPLLVFGLACLTVWRRRLGQRDE